MAHVPQQAQTTGTAAPKFQPYIKPTDSPAEFTAKAVILGVLFGLIFGASTVYLGLRAGLTVSASIPIAVLAISVLKRLGGSTILENNIVQTIGSAGESLAAGVVFTIPALIFLLPNGPQLSRRRQTSSSVVAWSLRHLLDHRSNPKGSDLLLHPGLHQSHRRHQQQHHLPLPLHPKVPH